MNTISSNTTQQFSPTKQPLISIVMATYNGENFLEQQLKSVLQQSYKNIEIIVVDDCSNDGTISIIERYKQLYPNIVLHKNKRNLGYIKNFENGCLLAKGDFIALCDQDDAWHKDKIQKQYEAIGNYPMIYCDSILADENLKPIGSNISNRVNCINFDNCLQQAVFCRIYGHATLIKTSFLKKAIPFLEIIPHDWWLCYMATLHGGIKYLPEPLAYYRQHSNNIFGAAGGKSRKHNKLDKAAKRKKERQNARIRIKAFYDACPNCLVKEKKVLGKLVKTYQSFSLLNNWQRMVLFFCNYELLLASKKRSPIRKWLFCLKMFVKIA